MNRLVKQFFLQYPKPLYNLKQTKQTQLVQGVRKQIVKKSKVFSVKYKLAQAKLKSQIQAYFKQIKACKEQKAMLAL